MPFKDSKEGQTHPQNDGCGEPAHNDMETRVFYPMEFQKPKGWRKGQTISNFLNWIRKEAGITDLFYTSDNEFEILFSKFLEKYVQRESDK